MKETDLDKVRTMAKVFLEIEIGETEMTPAKTKRANGLILDV